MNETTNVNKELSVIRTAIAELSNGKWDKRDAAAIVSLLGGIAGLASLLLLMLQSTGVL